MRSIFFISSMFLLSFAALGCGDDNDAIGTKQKAGMGGSSAGGGTGGGMGGGTGGGTGGTSTGGNAGSSTGGSGGEDAGADMAMARVAHLSPDAPPVDFCVDGGSGFIGPVLKGAGDTDGLAYSEVTSYLPLPPGTYDVRIVAPNADGCAPFGG